MSILSEKAGHDLFVYGSLQDPQVVNVLLNRVPDHASAVLSGLYVSLYLSHTLSQPVLVSFMFSIQWRRLIYWLFLVCFLFLQSQVQNQESSLSNHSTGQYRRSHRKGSLFLIPHVLICFLLIQDEWKRNGFVICFSVDMVLFLPSLFCLILGFSYKDLRRLLFLQVLKGITDDERKLLDDFEDVEYDRKAVEVVLTVTLLFGSEQPILYIYVGVWVDSSVINLLMFSDCRILQRSYKWELMYGRTKMILIFMENGTLRFDILYITICLLVAFRI